VRAGTDRFEHCRTVLKNGEDDDGHVREPFLDAARALATAEARQVEVHEDQVPPGVFAAIEDRIQLGQRGGGGLERADQLEILRVAEEHLETGAVAGVILNGHDADHTYTPGTGSERPGWRYRPAAAARPTRSCRRPRPSEAAPPGEPPGRGAGDREGEREGRAAARLRAPVDRRADLLGSLPHPVEAPAPPSVAGLGVVHPDAVVAHGELPAPAAPAREGEDDAPGSGVTGRVVERFQPDPQEVAAERQRQLRCGPLARGTETELDIVAREEAFTVFHETAGQLLEGRGARVQRPDGIGERAPQLLRSAGDLLGDPALL